MTSLKVLGWGHRRAIDPLRAAIDDFRRLRPDVTIELVVRPLSDFEHQGIDAVARLYDMVVYDHPFSGDIAAGDVFLPLDARLPAQLDASKDSLYVGPTLRSYRYRGCVWGAPIDAATQHAVLRKDVLEAANEPVPESWQQAIALGSRLRTRGQWLGMAIETPHALMTIGSLMANAGTAWSTGEDQPLTIDRRAFESAYDQLAELLALCPPEALGWNSIDLHEAMVVRDDVAYCPCVYGYAAYGETDMRAPLSFSDFAGSCRPFHAGSTVGGTAVGVSRNGGSPDSALAFAEYLLNSRVQDVLIPEHHGQPALDSAWRRPENDARFNGFYSAVRASMETAWVRPRIEGYSHFQREAGQAVAGGLRGELSKQAAIDSVIKLADQVSR